MLNVNLPLNAWDYILRTLGTRPHDEVVSLHAEIRKQLSMNATEDKRLDNLKDKINSGNIEAVNKSDESKDA